MRPSRELTHNKHYGKYAHPFVRVQLAENFFNVTRDAMDVVVQEQ